MSDVMVNALCRYAVGICFRRRGKKQVLYEGNCFVRIIEREWREGIQVKSDNYG